MTIGIYILYFDSADEQYYIGKSINSIEGRYKKHCSDMCSNIHHSWKVQQAYDKYSALPTMELLEEVDDLSTIYDREVYWIRLFDSYYNGLNCTPGGEGEGYGEDKYNAVVTNNVVLQIICELGNTTKRLVDIAKEFNVPIEVVNNISCGSSWGFMSKKYPMEYAKMLSKVGSRTLNIYAEDIYESIVIHIANTTSSMVELSEITGISVHVIKDISTGKAHKYLADKLPVEYAKMMAKVGTRTNRSTPYPDILSPEGIIYQVKVASTFAAEHGLMKSHLGAVLRGDRPSHKGWTLAP
jgi:hypothetical protein